jgi:hypothetical protein
VIGSVFLVIVVLTHICEATGIIRWMRWGQEDGIGHYLDLGSAVLGVALFTIGYCLYALTVRKVKGNPASVRRIYL